jgi:hypothetical protein
MQLAECFSKRRKTVENDKSTRSYAPFQAKWRVGESKTTCIMKSEFGVWSWRLAEIKWGWGWDWGRSFGNFVKFNSALMQIWAGLRLGSRILNFCWFSVRFSDKYFRGS